MKFQRDYSLFEMTRSAGRNHYQRLSDIAVPKETAIRVFQNDLLAPYFQSGLKPRVLRPVKDSE